MKRIVAAAGFSFGLLFLGLGAAYAQHGSADVVVVRPGDTIEWFAVGPPKHKVRFGANGATPTNEVSALLDFNPALVDGDSPERSTGKLLTAKVKDNATVGKTFVFTCGVHPGAMLSLPFKIEAKVTGEQPRTHKIMGVVGLHWHLHVDTTP
jgi:hypothetical protein